MLGFLGAGSTVIGSAGRNLISSTKGTAQQYNTDKQNRQVTRVRSSAARTSPAVKATTAVTPEWYTLPATPQAAEAGRYGRLMSQTGQQIRDYEELRRLRQLPDFYNTSNWQSTALGPYETETY